MKKIILIMFLCCNSLLFANLNTIVSILPQQTFVKAIGGDKVDVSLMVKPGNSPHTYEPKPSQMKDIAEADIYFTIGVEFEDAWLDKFSNQNKQMIISDSTIGIKKIAMKSHHHGGDHEEHHEKNEEHHDGKDPHTWTSPKNVEIIAKNIYNELIKIDAENTNYYKKNLDKFLIKIHNTDREIQNILRNTPKNTKFLVFHPSWGYFAKEYHLIQVPIEVEGKSPKPQTLKFIIEEAKEENAKAIFTSPEFSDKIAKSLAHELKIPVIQISPLSENWSENLKTFAKALSTKKM
ncbi:metal ABC transporter solute-binding protein, Zn/Mn family [Sulfurospirillum arcachonense]|uniref:metal ABC transporter solute-binding protein, Zn/Mn family n=1 Tax=Sulfurospirillum arcachonense TaxID=57666 RepID=UPI00046930C7|nr:zinc ABC transporter substrate-binding protein [Sulfurospirillum arcachonense]